MLSVFCSPSRYTQGKNATSALGTEMVGLGLSGPALIVASRSPIRLLSETWKSTLAQAGIAYAVHEFGGECSLAEIEHGEKVAFGLLTQLVLEGQPRSVMHRVLGFATEVGLPITLADIGLTELPKEVLQKIAVRATAENDTIHNEPFEVRPDMVADAIMAADAMGRAWRKDRSPH